MTAIKEIKKGFQKTEVGVIPVDWEVIPLEKLSYRIGDGIHTTPKYSDNGDYFFVNGNNLDNGKISISNDTKRVSKEEYLIHRRELNNGTILLSINGTIGNIAFYRNEKIVLGKSAAYINLNEKIDKKILYQIVQTEFIKKYFENELTGSTIRNLGLGSIRNTPIPLPPTLSEQTTIATALNDADALITQLEKLIAKKRAIKQGAMQELLKPKEGWEERKLGEIVKSIQLGGNYKNGERSNSYPLIKMGNIQRGYISLNKIEYTQDCIPDKKDRLKFGDLLFNTRNTLELVGKVAIWRNELQEAYFNSNLMRIEFFPEYVSSNFFINSIFNARYSIQKLKDLATGTTSVAAIYTRDLLKMELSLPSLDDQIRIAQILSDMDSEIEILEKKLEKYKEIKQGMMQELLTGKIRLDH